MLRKRIRAILVPTLLLLSLFMAAVLLLNALVHKPSVQQRLLARFSEALDYDLKIRQIEISFWRGVGFDIEGLVAASRSRPERIIAPRATITLHLGELLRGGIFPKRVYLYRPQIYLGAGEKGPTEPPGDVSAFKELLLSRLGRLAFFSLEGARIRIKDAPFSLQDLYFDVLDTRSDLPTHRINIRGKFNFRKALIPFRVRGTLTAISETGEALSGDVTLDADGIPLKWIPWPVEVAFAGGVFGGNIRLQGTLDNPVKAQGRLVMKDVHFSLVDEGFAKPYRFHRLTFDFAARYRRSVLEVPFLTMKAPDFTLKVDSRLNLRNLSNPHLTLKVTAPAMPLETFEKIFPSPFLSPWIEKPLFSSLTGGSVLVDLFSLTGSLEQIQHLGRPANAPVLSLKVHYENLRALEAESPLPFKGVSGALSIEKGGLHVSGLKGRFGQSVIQDGTLGIDDLYKDILSYRIAINGSFYLEDLLEQRESDLIPKEIRAHLFGLDEVSGKVDATLGLRFQEGWDSPRVENGELLFKECRLMHKKSPFPLRLGEVEVEVDENGSGRFRGRGAWGRSTFDTMGMFRENLRWGRAHIVGRADLNGIMGQIAPEGPALTVSEPLICQFTLSKVIDVWACEGEIDLVGVRMKTGPLSIAPRGNQDRVVFSLDLRPGGQLKLRDFVFNLGDSSLGLSGTYDLKGKDAFSLHALTADFSLQDLGIASKQSRMPLKGHFSCDVGVEGSLRDLWKTRVNGKLRAKDLSIVSQRLPTPLRPTRLECDFQDHTAHVKSLALQIGTSDLYLRGRLTGWNGLHGKLLCDARYLDVSDFIKKAEAEAPDTSPWLQSPFVRRSDIEVNLRVLKGRWRRLKLKSSQISGALRSGDLIVDGSFIQWENGMMDLRGHAKGGDHPEILFSTYVKTQDQPVGDLIQSLGIEGLALEGRLQGEALLFSRGRGKQDLLGGLTGSANLHLEKGEIRKSHVIFRVLEFLSLQNIFKKKPPDLSKEGFYFESIQGHLLFNKGILETNNLVMKSPVFNAAAGGTLNLADGAMDFDLGAQPLETVDLVVSKIPLLGYILTGQNKTLIVYHFKVGGTRSNPEVRYVPLKDLGGGMKGFFKRLFLTPGRLFKKIPRPNGGLSEEEVQRLLQGEL